MLPPACACPLGGHGSCHPNAPFPAAAGGRVGGVLRPPRAPHLPNQAVQVRAGWGGAASGPAFPRPLQQRAAPAHCLSPSPPSSRGRLRLHPRLLGHAAKTVLPVRPLFRCAGCCWSRATWCWAFFCPSSMPWKGTCSRCKWVLPAALWPHCSAAALLGMHAARAAVPRRVLGFLLL